MSVTQTSPSGENEDPSTVLREYTDEHLTIGAARARGDEYGRRCRALLRLPVERRQSVSAEAWRETHYTPTEWRHTEHGPMAVSGMTEIVGDFAASVKRIVERELAAAPSRSTTQGRNWGKQ